jgi:hypothetical protein
MTETAGVHFLAGWAPVGSKHRAVCHCGWATTPRSTPARAQQALAHEHGDTQRADCSICAQRYDTRDMQIVVMTDVMEPLHDADRGRDVWVCRDKVSCTARYAAQQPTPAHQGADAAGLDLFKLPDELAVRRQARAHHQKGL